MTYSDKTLALSLTTLDADKALALIGLAGSLTELNSLITKLCANFNVTLPETARTALADASKRFYAVKRHKHVSYLHA